MHWQQWPPPDQGQHYPPPHAQYRAHYPMASPPVAYPPTQQRQPPNPMYQQRMNYMHPNPYMPMAAAPPPDVMHHPMYVGGSSPLEPPLAPLRSGSPSEIAAFQNALKKPPPILDHATADQGTIDGPVPPWLQELPADTRGTHRINLRNTRINQQAMARFMGAMLRQHALREAKARRRRQLFDDAPMTRADTVAPFDTLSAQGLRSRACRDYIALQQYAISKEEELTSIAPGFLRQDGPSVQPTSAVLKWLAIAPFHPCDGFFLTGPPPSPSKTESKRSDQQGPPFEMQGPPEMTSSLPLKMLLLRDVQEPEEGQSASSVRDDAFSVSQRILNRAAAEYGGPLGILVPRLEVLSDGVVDVVAILCEVFKHAAAELAVDAGRIAAATCPGPLPLGAKVITVEHVIAAKAKQRFEYQKTPD